VSLAVVAFGGTVLIVHESFGFKIVMDEVMLVGTSMSMHFTRTVLTPIRGGDVQGAFVIFEGMMDKRQLFFPFLVSILHDLTGYRPENAFVLNAILTFVFLGLVNALGRKLAGRMAGWLGVALFAGLPLLAQNATGGGFELLNIVMILATMLLGARFIERATGPRSPPSATRRCSSRRSATSPRSSCCRWRRSSSGCGCARAGRDDLAGDGAAAPHDPLRAPHADLRHPGLVVAAAEQARVHEAVLALLRPGQPGARARVLLRQVDRPAQLLRALGPGLRALLFFILLVAKRLRALGSESPISVATHLLHRRASRPSSGS
jgi:hypothetical protein